MQQSRAWMGWGLGLGLLALAGCAELETLSTVTLAPQVTFERLESVAIQPEGIRVEAVVSVKSQMRVPLPLQGLEYRLEVNDQLFMKGTFDRFQEFASRGRQEVTLPFLVPWGTVLPKRAGASPRKEFRLALRGSVQVGGAYALANIPFAMTKVIPVPAWPEIAFAGTEGVFGTERFAVKLRVKNPNAFAISLNQCETVMVLNQQTYDLAYVQNAADIAPGASRIISLNLEHAGVKGVGMLVNALVNQRLDFRVQGKTVFGTPFGTLQYAFDQPGKSP